MRAVDKNENNNFVWMTGVVIIWLFNFQSHMVPTAMENYEDSSKTTQIMNSLS